MYGMCVARELKGWCDLSCVSFVSQSVVNVKPEVKDETEEEKEQKHKSFVEKYEKEIKHFGKMKLEFCQLYSIVKNALHVQ